MMSLCALTAPLLRTLKKILTRCVKITYMQEHGTSCPPFLSNIRDLAILPKILQIETPWWKLSLDTVANLFQQETDGLIHLLTFDTRSIDPVIIHSIGQAILHYRQTIRQDLPFRLKRLHVWNVSGWTPAQMGNDPKLRLIRRLLHTGPVALQETRWHQETPQILYHTIPGIQVAHTAGLQTERGGVSGGTAILLPPGWRLDRMEEIIPGRAVLAVVQDRYTTIGLISTYLHPHSKSDELKELVRWLKANNFDYPIYVSGDFNQADISCPDTWNDLLIYGKVTDPHPTLQTFEGPNGFSALDKILCPTDYIAAAQVDVLIATHRRHHLSGHYQLTAKFIIRPCVQSDMKDPIHQTIPSDVFCPGRTEADPYSVPNDLQSTRTDSSHPEKRPY